MVAPILRLLLLSPRLVGVDKKGDYGAVRLLQMLWRLNFLVVLLCMAMGNTYILYYICPLHTFYFFVVYAIMSPARCAGP